MKFYEFLDKQPAIGRLVIVEGTERALAERALDVLLDRLLPAEVRDLNLARFGPDDLGDMAHLREAVRAMPFLADRRVVVVSEAQALRADPRRALFAVTQDVPEGNTLVVSDLLSPRSARPQSLGSLAGRAALRIDTTADEQTRARFRRRNARTLTCDRRTARRRRARAKRGRFNDGPQRPREARAGGQEDYAGRLRARNADDCRPEGLQVCQRARRRRRWQSAGHSARAFCREPKRGRRVVLGDGNRKRLPVGGGQAGRPNSRPHALARTHPASPWDVALALAAPASPSKARCRESKPS